MDKTEAKEDLQRKNGNEEQKEAQQPRAEQPLAEEETSEEEAEDSEEAEDPAAKLKEELEAAKDKYIRLYSEFENFRKRTAREKLELIQSANEQLLRALLPVADDFERAENAFPDKNDKDLAGFFLIHSKFRKALELYGIKLMEIGKGTDFNADFHEAISQVDAPSADLKGKIVDVVEKGYFLNDKVIRFAKVVVGK